MRFTATFAVLSIALFSSTSLAFPTCGKSGHGARRHIETQGHRGALGMKPESTLYAMAHALEIGVDVLEMDMVFTKDRVPVIWHDHYIYPTKCKDTTGNFVGKFIANLTLAEVKTLDCGSLQLSSHTQQKLYPGAKIATLEEVLDLVECYGDKRVGINLETKLDPVAQNETLDVSVYINDIVPILKRRDFHKRTTIQSFDWRTLIGIKKKFPYIETVALLDPTTIIPEDRGVGGYPWLGGIDLEKDFSGDFVAAAKSIRASVLSPVHGVGRSVNAPGYTPFVTKDIVKKAHKVGLKVIPWTVDDESTMATLIDNGVDGIISNYPERSLAVARAKGYTSGLLTTSRAPRPRCLKKGGAASYP